MMKRPRGRPKLPIAERLVRCLDIPDFDPASLLLPREAWPANLTLTEWRWTGPTGRSYPQKHKYINKFDEVVTCVSCSRNRRNLIYIDGVPHAASSVLYSTFVGPIPPGMAINRDYRHPAGINPFYFSLRPRSYGIYAPEPEPELEPSSELQFDEDGLPIFSDEEEVAEVVDELVRSWDCRRPPEFHGWLINRLRPPDLPDYRAAHALLTDPDLAQAVERVLKAIQ